MRTLVIAAVVLWTGTVQAQMTIGYTTSFPGNDVIYGCPVTFFVKGLPRTPNGLIWETRSKGDCVTGFRPLPGINEAWTHWTYMDIPGTFEVRCTITYPFDRATRTTPKADVKTLDIAVPPPDGVRIVQGDGRIYRVGMDIPVVLVITCKGEDVCTAYGLAQERITGWTFMKRKLPLPSPWVPSFPDFRFFRSGNTIVDLKLTREIPLWSKIPKGTYSESVQEFRLVIPDLCGNPKEYPLDTYDVKWVKTDDISYKILHTRRP